jgi:hypothetical protein
MKLTIKIVLFIHMVFTISSEVIADVEVDDDMLSKVSFQSTGLWLDYKEGIQAPEWQSESICTRGTSGDALCFLPYEGVRTTHTDKNKVAGVQITDNDTKKFEIVLTIKFPHSANNKKETDRGHSDSTNIDSAKKGGVIVGKRLREDDLDKAVPEHRLKRAKVLQNPGHMELRIKFNSDKKNAEYVDLIRALNEKTGISGFAKYDIFHEFSVSDGLVRLKPDTLILQSRPVSQNDSTEVSSHSKGFDSPQDNQQLTRYESITQHVLSRSSRQINSGHEPGLASEHDEQLRVQTEGHELSLNHKRYNQNGDLSYDLTKSIDFYVTHRWFEGDNTLEITDHKGLLINAKNIDFELLIKLVKLGSANVIIGYQIGQENLADKSFKQITIIKALQTQEESSNLKSSSIEISPSQQPSANYSYRLEKNESSMSNPFEEYKFAEFFDNRTGNYLIKLYNTKDSHSEIVELKAQNQACRFSLLNKLKSLALTLKKMNIPLSYNISFGIGPVDTLTLFLRREVIILKGVIDIQLKNKLEAISKETPECKDWDAQYCIKMAELFYFDIIPMKVVEDGVEKDDWASDMRAFSITFDNDNAKANVEFNIRISKDRIKYLISFFKLIENNSLYVKKEPKKRTLNGR